MGKDRNEVTRGNSLGRPNPAAGKKDTNGFEFTSFYPTKEEKEEIREMGWTAAQLVEALGRCTASAIVVTIKDEPDRDCYKLLLREDVPFGQPCKAVAFWHTSHERLIAMYLYWMKANFERWRHAEPGTTVQQAFDW